MVEEKGVYRDLQYQVLFQDTMGHRCGYVGIPEGFVAYGREWDDYMIDCHGGITFSEECDRLGPDLWWIGFDCNHNDGIDIDAIRKYFGDKEAEQRKTWPDYERRQHFHAYTLEECVEECKHIIDQVLEMEN